jgi:predicted alpha/beta-hydrolase family hydrolase
MLPPMTVLLYPGAGSDSTHPSLVTTQATLAPHSVVLADFPYRKEGRKAPDRPPKLLAAIRDELADVPADEPLVMGGRSMGGRMCSMIAAGVDDLPAPANLKGLVLISYPLHPPGKPESLRPNSVRVEHLTHIRVPTLFISGSNDTFGSPEEIRRWTTTMPAAAKVRHIFLDGLGHDLKGADHTIAGAIKDFLVRLRMI